MYSAYSQWMPMRRHLHPHLDLGLSRARASRLDPDVDTRSRPSLVQRETSPRPSSSCLVRPVLSSWTVQGEGGRLWTPAAALKHLAWLGEVQACPAIPGLHLTVVLIMQSCMVFSCYWMQTETLTQCY